MHGRTSGTAKPKILTDDNITNKEPLVNTEGSYILNIEIKLK